MVDVIEPARVTASPTCVALPINGTNTRVWGGSDDRAQMADVDAALRRATDAGEVAGVVAMAATVGRAIYQGRVRAARHRHGRGDDAGHGAGSPR